MTTLFTELGLSAETLRAVEEAGYITPTPIQANAIPLVLSGRDLMATAQTGTGKTAGFTLPMIEILARGRARARMPRSLILEPTRELAAQVDKNFEIYGRYHRLNTALLVGGESMGDQRAKLDRGVDVLIATPGRLIDLFERGNILLSDMKILVIDECDRMLDMGFIPDIERIVSMLPRRRQTLMFSATMPPEIRRLASAFLDEPEEIRVDPPASTAVTVTQGLVLVGEKDKRKALRHLLRSEDVKNAFIFCNRKRDIARLHQSLQRHGFNAGALHGDMVQSMRTETLQKFKDGLITLLVCSDVAARGLDVQGLSHVFNFDVPFNPEDYIHRIGRTGRAGRSGRALTLATPDDAKLVDAIARVTGKPVPTLSLEGFDITAGDDDDEGGERRDERRSRRGERDDRRRGGRSRDDRPREPQAREDRPREDRPREDRPRDDRPREDRSREDRVREEAMGEVRRPPRRSDGPPPAFAAGEERAPRRWRRDDDERDSGPPIVGFGDHTPAFLIRPAPRRRPVPLDAPAGAEDDAAA